MKELCYWISRIYEDYCLKYKLTCVSTGGKKCFDDSKRYHEEAPGYTGRVLSKARAKRVEIYIWGLWLVRTLRIPGLHMLPELWLHLRGAWMTERLCDYDRGYICNINNDRQKKKTMHTEIVYNSICNNCIMNKILVELRRLRITGIQPWNVTAATTLIIEENVA